MRVSFIVLILLLASCQTIQAPQREGAALPTPTTPLSQTGPFLGDKPTDIEALVRQFDRTVFFVETIGSYPFVRKWTGDIRYAIEPANRADKYVEFVAGRLQPVVGVRMVRVYEAANVGFMADPKDRRGYYCHILAYTDPGDGSVIQARIFISDDWPDEHLAECVEEEFSQILGPGNDTLVLEQSLWRPYEHKTYRGLTWSDAVILRALYDERLKPGMHRDKAMPLVRQIIGELLEELNR